MRPPMADLRASYRRRPHRWSRPKLNATELRGRGPEQSLGRMVEHRWSRLRARKRHGISRRVTLVPCGPQSAANDARIDSRADNPAYAGCSALCACERYADPRADRTGSRAVSLRLACSSLACEASALAPRRRMYRDPQASMQTEPQMSGRSAARRWRAS